MGIWTRSPKSIEIARNHKGLQAEYRAALPNYDERDVVGSPYSIYKYKVDPALGGDSGLKIIREQLLQKKKLLILDFVPRIINLVMEKDVSALVVLELIGLNLAWMLATSSSAARPST